MKTLQKLALIGILGLSGCKIPGDSYGTYENYPFKLHNYLGGKRLTLYLDQKSAQKSDCSCSSYIEFEDENNDGRFDSINLNQIEKGNSIERFANLETGQKLLGSLLDKKE
jgi:hypothetical protein